MHARVENYRPADKFDTIISRAFSELSLFVGLTKRLIKENGQWLAMKGQVPQDELKDLSLGPAQIIPLMVAGLEAKRHLVVLENNQ